jgi:hypothetical protein
LGHCSLIPASGLGLSSPLSFEYGSADVPCGEMSLSIYNGEEIPLLFIPGALSCAFKC